MTRKYLDKTKLVLVFAGYLLPVIIATIMFITSPRTLWLSLIMLPLVFSFWNTTDWKWPAKVSLIGVSYTYFLYFMFRGEKVDNLSRLISGTFVLLIVIGVIGYLKIQNNKLYKKLEGLAQTDALTGAYNRRYILNNLEDVIKNSGGNISVTALDIDFFKKINDTYGHGCGDVVLKEVSRLIMGGIRGSDVLIRTGGEEFLLVLPNIKFETGQIIAERIRESIENHNFGTEAGMESLKVTISLGITNYRRGEKIEDMINRADKALYEAKQTGRNKVVASA